MKKRESRRDFMRTLGAITATAFLGNPLEALAENTESKKVIVLDPGHGMDNRRAGHDPGASYSGYKESEIVLAQAKAIEEILEKDGYKVFLTREDETTSTPLNSRAPYANKENADIFVSLHCNAAESSSARGIETYHHPTSKNGKKLASSIQNSLMREFGNKTRDRGIKTATYKVLTATKMPAVLVESGFLSNETDREYLTEQGDNVAQAIAEGIKNYFE